MQKQIQIPEKMKSLPISKKYGVSIPYFVPIIDGEPNFRLADQEKLQNCFDHLLCGCCGKRLEKRRYFFVGGPFTLRNEVSTDAPMHYLCAAYAVQVCPHIFYYKAERKIGVPAFERDIITDKPPRLYIMESSYLQYRVSQGHKLFYFRVGRTVARFDYVDNQLQPTGTVDTKREREFNTEYINDYIRTHG